MPSTFGAELRQWRHLRGMSQQRLAEGAEVSPRHVSFLENGKARPSREMVLVLANALDLPLRGRNDLLAAAGFAAVYRETPWTSQRMGAIERALDHLLAAHEPYGAIVVDRAWNVRRVNAGAARLFAAFWSMPPPPNVVHAMFDPALRDVLEDWEGVMGALVPRWLREAVGSPELARLLEDALSAPGVPEGLRRPRSEVSLEPTLVVGLRRGDLRARLFTTLTSLGTPLDVTAEDVRIESYFPADDETDAFLRRLAAATPAPRGSG